MPNVTSSKIITMACEVDGRQWLELTAVQYPFLLVGAAELEHVNTDTPTLCSMFVHPDLRRIGIATQLIKAAKHWTDSREKDLFLHVNPDNQAARQLYEALGFQYTGEKNDDGNLWMISCAWDGRIEEAKEGGMVSGI